MAIKESLDDFFDLTDLRRPPAEAESSKQTQIEESSLHYIRNYLHFKFKLQGFNTKYQNPWLLIVVANLKGKQDMCGENDMNKDGLICMRLNMRCKKEIVKWGALYQGNLILQGHVLLEAF